MSKLQFLAILILSFPSCRLSPCVIQYNVVDKENFNNLPTMVERNFLNDSIFIQKSNYYFVNQQSEETVDTFKIVHNTWYYLWNGKFRLYFSESDFLKGIPVNEYLGKYAGGDTSLYEYFKWTPDTVYIEGKSKVFVFSVTWIKPNIYNKGSYSVEKMGSLDFDPVKGIIERNDFLDSDRCMENYAIIKRSLWKRHLNFQINER